MQFNEYLKKRAITQKQAAKELGISPVTIYRWGKGDKPHRHTIERVEQWSNGAVTERDWLGIRLLIDMPDDTPIELLDLIQNEIAGKHESVLFKADAIYKVIYRYFRGNDD